MSGRSRLALKLLWMAVLMTAFVLLGHVRYDFVYGRF
jgi:hypothetical protein